MIDYKLATDTWDLEEFNAINRVIESNRFTCHTEVESFEEDFCNFFNTNYATMVNSGSSANLIAIASLIYSNKYNLKKGDEVIVPAVSWATTYTVLYQHGLKLRFVDIDINTLNIDLDKVEEAITEKTKAIFAVNLLGNPNNFKRLLEICEKHDLILIEDNCESMGAKYENKYAGTFGVMGTFSTFYSHHMATMEGGMILTEDPELKDIAHSLRSHGWTRNLSDNSPYHTKKDEFYEMFNFIFPGYNVRPIEMEAAIGREQLKKLDNFLKERKENGKYFIDLFSQLESVQIQENTDDSSFFGFSLIFENNNIRQNIINVFNKEGVECRPIVAGNFTKNKVISFFDYSIHGNLTNADKIHENGLFIGNHHYDIKDKLDDIFKLIKNNI